MLCWTHRLLDDVGPLRRHSVLWVLLKEAAQVLEGRSEGSAHLACVPPVDDLDPLLSCQAVDVDLVGVPAAVPLLLGPPVVEVELHLHLVHPLDTTQPHFCSHQSIFTAGLGVMSVSSQKLV